MKKKIILTGDFNINTLKPSKIVKYLTDLINNYNLIFYIKEPTRQQSCIDHIIGNQIKHAYSEVLKLGLSDHTAQMLNIPVKAVPKQPDILFIARRDYDSHNIEKFRNCMKSLSFTESYNDTNINSAYNTFHEDFLLYYNLCFPLMRHKIVTKNRDPKWITKGLRRSCNTKRILRYKFYRVNTKQNKIKYQTYSKILKRCLSQSQKLCNLSFISKSQNKCKAAWRVINDDTEGNVTYNSISEIKVGSHLISEPEVIANEFNKFYINMTNTPTNSIQNTNKTSIQNSLFLKPLSILEVEKIIVTLNSCNSVGYDGISTKILKICAKVIAPIMTHLINLSFEQGIFPERLKRSVIRPIYKRKGDKIDMTNYRPITLIPIISKIFEKAMHKQITSFLNQFKIIKPEQNGFQKGKSTTLAAFSLVHNVICHVDKNIPTMVIFFDMSKAFDFVSHKLLLEKLQNYGIRGPALKWLESYLFNRLQCVEISYVGNDLTITNSKSSYKLNSCGVPQGSVLGPLLFLLYINDLVDITNYKCILFADDISIILTCKDTTNYDDEINKTIQLVLKWLECNNLKANLNKTKFVQFKSKRSNITPIDILNNDIKNNETDCIKFLGLTLDKHNDWKMQIDIVCNKINRFVYVLSRLRKTSTLETTMLAYHGYVSSTLRYGLLLWGNSTDVSRAFLSQKRCIRAIVGIPPEESCKPHFKKLGILTLSCMYILEICVFVRSHPNLFTKAKDKFPRNTRNPHRLVLNCTPRTTMFMKNCYAMCIQIYNKIPDCIKELPFILFKKHLKAWLLDRAYYSIHELK